MDKYTQTKKIIRMAFFCLGILLLSAAPSAASLARQVKHGNELYRAGDFSSSIEEYKKGLEKDEDSDIMNFNLGTAYYKTGDFEKASTHFQRVLLGDDDKLKQKAYYNLGNSLYSSGIAAEDKNIDSAIKAMEQSAGRFESAIGMDSEDEDAKHNLEFVKQELQRLRQKKQEQQQQQKQDQKQDQKKDQEKKQEQSQGGQSQDQQQQNQQQKEQSNQEQSAQTSKQQEGQDQQNPSGQSQSNPAQQQPEQQDNQNSQSSDSQEKSTGDQSSDGDKDQTDTKSAQSSGKQDDGENNDAQQPAAGAMVNGEELTPEEAQRLIDQYQQSEQQRGLLNVFKGKADSRPVLKDW